jgi:glycosyltransferase involved in cell wall biosynthesis
MKNKKVLIVTTGQPSTNPRMLKEYGALKKAGYQVKVFYSFWADWAVETDEALFQNGLIDKKDFILTGGSPGYNKRQYFVSRLFFKIFHTLSFKLGLSFFNEWAISRTAFWLSRAAKREKADLYIAHNMGALPAVVKAAGKWNAYCGFDAEDYHRGTYNNRQSKECKLTAILEERYMPHCNYVTAASPLIGETYQQLLNLNLLTIINNVFSIANIQPFREEPGVNGELRLFWFSQTMGSDRGLEDVVCALELLKDHNIKLTLLGLSSSEYRNSLLNRLSNQSMLTFMEPVAPTEIFALTAGAHIGIVSEQLVDENKNVCLANKLFTYLLAGNCVLASDTKAQKKFLEDNPGIGVLYYMKDPNSIADALRMLYNDRALLNRYRKAALDLGRNIFNWEEESKKLISVVDKLLLN